ncbi:MAG: OB-fold nucleic acid binding domain-containing protein [Clostridia bacterium]|nr:OB-fold nucleic acid binding domain-containing protein [Clostridia bacterium]
MKKLTKIVLLVVVLVMSLVLATACETLENHEHKPDESLWFSDGTNHWHVCTFKGCAEELDKTTCSGGTATYTEKAICSTCGNSYGELLEDDRPLAERFEHITIAQACELAIAAGETPTATEYTIVGTIVTVSNGLYGEMTVQDETGSIYIYGCEFSDGTLYGDAEDKPVKGDIVVIKGVLKAFNGTPEMSTQSNRAEILAFEHVKVEIDTSEYPAKTIAEVRDAQKDTKAKLSGVVAAITYANGKKPSGVILVDDTASIYVYSQDIAQQVSVGNTIEVAGSKTYWILETEQSSAQEHGYIGACQMENAVLVSNDKQVSEFDKSWIETTTVKELLNTGFNQNVTSLVVKSTAIVNKVVGTGFTNYYINDLDDKTGSYVYTQCNGSDFAWLDEFDGKVCEVYYTLLNAKSTAAGCVWRLLPVKVSEIKGFSFPASDVPAFAIEYGVVDLIGEGVFGADPVITLPNSYDNDIIGASNVTLAYQSSDTTVATVTKGQDGTVLNLVGEGECNITVTATFGSYTASKTIAVKLDPFADIQTPTVAEIIATADGTEVTLRGIVMSSVVNQKGGFYIADDTGMIAVRATADEASQLKVGQEVVVKGTKKHVLKDGYTIAGQCAIDDATVVANYYGDNTYNTSWYITDKTISDLVTNFDPNVDLTTNVYVLNAKFVVKGGGYSITYYLQDPNNAENELLLYTGGSQYSWLADYDGQVISVELAICNWNSKTDKIRGCIVAVTVDGQRIVNTFNFAQ